MTQIEKLAKLFDHIKEEWRKDSQIDFDIKDGVYSENLSVISLDTPFQHNKYLNHHSDLSLMKVSLEFEFRKLIRDCLLYTSPSPRDQRGSRMPSSA